MANQKLLVSIIIPTYNRKDLLGMALRDLERQSLDNALFEVIVVDDGSSDGTEELVKEISGSLNFQISIFKQQHRGLGAARNLGVKNSKAELIAFHDDDMTVHPEWLQKALAYFEDEAVFAVEGKTKVKGKIGSFTRYVYNESGGVFLGCNMFYRKRILNELNGFDTVLFAEDYDMALRILGVGGKIPFAKDVVAFHQVVPVRAVALLKRAALSKFIPYLFKKHGEKIRPYLGFRIQRVLAAIFFIIFVYSSLKLSFFGMTSSLLGMILMTTCLMEERMRQIKSIEILKVLPVYIAADALTFFMFLYGCVKYRVMPNVKMFRR